MRTVSALFGTDDQVVAAVDDLAEAGIPTSDITVIHQGRGSRAKAKEGATLGAGFGLLAGLAVLALPGVGAAVGAAWLVPSLIGVAAGGVAGGIIGSLNGDDTQAAGADLPCGGRGGTLLVARVHDSEVGTAKAILLQSGAIDTNMRRSETAADCWEGFVAQDIWDEDIGSEDADRRNRPAKEPVDTPLPK